MKFSTSKPKIIVIGSSSIDLVLNVPNYPAQNETIMATKVESFFGGKGSNQAVACARLGASVYFAGAVGMDPFGQQIMRTMKDEGVHVGFVYESIDSETGTAYVTAFGNKNTIVVVPAANSTINKEQINDLEKFIPTADVIFRTCRNFPSVTTIEAQDVGPWRSSRIFLPLSPKLGTSLTIKALQGLVLYFIPSKPISTPFCIF